MTSIAVTASICASAAEAALLVATFFMPVSLDLGVTHRCAKSANNSLDFTRNTPRRVFALLESPLSEYQQSHGRTALRRHFGSGMLLRRQAAVSVLEPDKNVR